MDNLPTITMTNGPRVLSHGIGIINLFPFLIIDNVLYVPRSPFKLLSISYLLVDNVNFYHYLSPILLTKSTFP